jgi:cell division septation protein DedD
MTRLAAIPVRPGVMRAMRLLAAWCLGLSAAHVSAAQAQSAAGATSTTASGSNDSLQRGISATAEARNVIERVRGLAGAGRGADARLLLDSLVVASASTSLNAAGSADANLAEALFWRATLSEQAADAERDWKRLLLDVPLSARAPAALLKLGDSETSRGRSSAARGYYERLLREYGAAPERWRASLGITRSYFDDRDVAHACASLAVARPSEVPEGELRLQAQALQTRCANEQAKLAAAPAMSDGRKDASSGKAISSPATGARDRANGADRADRSSRSPEPVESPTPMNTSGARYSVQVAAYDTKAQADAVVKKLAKRGYKVRVDGARKPYRVRVGAYTTRAEAEAALARMKKAGQKGFVAEITP